MKVYSFCWFDIPKKIIIKKKSMTGIVRISKIQALLPL